MKGADMDTAHSGQAIVAGNFQLQQQMPNGRTMTLSGYVFQGENADVLQSKIDMMMAVMDCTRGKAEIPELEHKARELEKQLAGAEEQAAALVRKGESKKLSSVEQQTLGTFEQTRRMYKEKLQEGLTNLIELKTKYGVA